MWKPSAIITPIVGICLLHSCAGRRLSPEAFEAMPQASSSSILQGIVKVSELPVHEPQNFYRVQFINAEEGWLYSHHNLYRTWNGGATWSLIFHTEDAQSNPVGEWLNEIKKVEFVNDQLGWMSTFGGKLHKTVDGGRTWTQSSLKVDFIADFKFLGDGQKGYVAGSFREADQKKDQPGFSATHIFRTFNAGDSWSEPTLSLKAIYLDRFDFIDDDHGFALAATGVYYFESGKWDKKIHFSDAWCGAGKSFIVPEDPNEWDEKYSDKGVPYTLDIAFINVKEGWVSFINGDVLHTVDGGRTWCRILNPAKIWPKRVSLGNSFSQIHFSDARNGWALDGLGNLYKTMNGGVTMTQINTGVRIDYIYFLNAQYGWAIAKDGLFRVIL